MLKRYRLSLSFDEFRGRGAVLITSNTKDPCERTSILPLPFSFG